MKAIIIPVFLLALSSVNAQAPKTDTAFSLSAYAELYYLYDFGKPEDHNRPSFLYSHNRAGEVNLNLGFVRAGYENERVRAGLALMAGTYANANLAAEPSTLQHIYEAFGGVKVSGKSNLWVDAGIFSSHFGFESAMGASSYTMTRSLVAESTPYYEAGVKLTYISANEKWLLSGLLLNGWQRIKRVDGNSMPSFGTQVTFTPNESLKLNSSTFIGTDGPDSTRRMRYFHNFFMDLKLSTRWSVIAGLDAGMQQKSKGSNDFNTWYAPVIIARYVPGPKWALAVRAEYFGDAGEVIISTPYANGFYTAGYSLNADRWITQRVCWRLEARLFASPDEIYVKDALPQGNNFSVGTALTLQF